MFIVLRVSQSDAKSKEETECEGNMEEELKTSQKMWYEPDSILNTYIVQVTQCQKS